MPPQGIGELHLGFLNKGCHIQTDLFGEQVTICPVLRFNVQV